LTTRTVTLEHDLLAHNAQHAEENRTHLASRNIWAVNLLSSPGSGKTTLLEATIRQLGPSHPIYAIEGDQQTDRDAARLRAAGARAHQIETGKACHLDAAMVGDALHVLAPEPGSTLFIENVGNLVCPAMFDLGESTRVVIASVTEGEDKPLKYPYMFRIADVVVISKIDLVPYLDFDLDAFSANLARVNPNCRVFQLSAKSGEGIEAWLRWLHGRGLAA
jgi:hydrogenase nickel incorporation protein HypB